MYSYLLVPLCFPSLLNPTDTVRNDIRSSWMQYMTHAFPMDTLRPVTLDGVNDYGGIALTAIDSLDTLWIANLRQEFDETVRRLQNLSFAVDNNRINVFETCIRVLGGLISAYHFSKNSILKSMLLDIAHRLLPAFSSSDLPFSDINLKTGSAFDAPWQTSSLSEVSSMGLELMYVAKLTGDVRFSEAVLRIQKTLNLDYLPGIFVKRNGVDQGIVSLGARGDSYYEYLLKCWIQDSSRIDLKEAFKRMMTLVEKNLLVQISDDKCFVDELLHNSRVEKMDHLVCFLPGVLQLGVEYDILDKHFSKHAQNILNTCVEMYNISPVGLAPEIIKRSENTLFVSAADSFNLLRPETFESLYHLRSLKNKKIAWSIYQNFSSHAKIHGAFSNVKNIMTKNTVMTNKMPSYWIAESLKYVYLIMSGEEAPKDCVFNTEAHFIPIFANN